VAYQGPNVINEIAQLIAGNIRLAVVYGAERSVQLSQQAVFLRSGERRSVDAAYQVLNNYLWRQHRHRKRA
jgi:hypothetical protein